MTSLPVRLKQTRKSVRATQGQVAERIGINKDQLCNYENGRHDPGIMILIALADYYGVTLDYLVGRKD